MKDRASASRRIAAALIDLLILWIGGSTLAYVVVGFFGEALDAWRVEDWEGLVFVLFWLLYGSFEIITAASPAKIILGLKITNVDGSKAPPSVLVLRWSTKYLPQMLLLVYLLSFNGAIQLIAGLMNAVIWIGCLQMLDEDKRSWLDQWARTAVIREKQEKVAGLIPNLP